MRSLPLEPLPTSNRLVVRFSQWVCGLATMMGMFFATIVSGGGGDPSQIRADSEKYVNSIDGCAFIDGYRCGNLIEDDFLSVGSQQKLISGNLLKAWQVALLDFQSQSDQSAAQTDLKHFRIGFTEDADYYIVLFQGLLMPLVEDDQIVGLTRVSLGRTTKYWVSKDTFVINKRLFYR